MVNSQYLNIQNNHFKNDLNKGSGKSHEHDCTEFEYDQEKLSDLDKFDFFKFIIFDHEGIFITVWKLIDVPLCLMSSWSYMYMTVFAIEGVDVSYMESWSSFLELFFTASMILGFLTDFKR